MTLLNRPSNGHVPTMMILWRALRVFGPMRRADLEALCRPRGVHEDPVAMKVFKGTFATWRSLGMFELENDDDPVRLAPQFASIASTDTERLRTAVLELLLQPENSPALLEVSAEENSRASDFVRVVSWALAQDPYRLAKWEQAQALTTADEQGLTLFHGDGRWAAFQEWAYFVGLGIPTRHGFVMSPARAVREALRSDRMAAVATTNEDIPLSIFLEKLAEEIPVLDGGAYRSKIDAIRSARGYHLAPRSVSPSLALALLQLKDEEEILLADRGGDVTSRISLMGREGRVVKNVSHIRRGPGRHRLSTDGRVEAGGRV
jgi:hypothetical protein